MRIGTKSLLDCRSSRLVSGLFTPWALVHHYLTLGCSDSTWTNSVTQHFPLCTNCFRWDLFYTLWSFMYIYICLCRSYDEKRIAMKYKTSSTSSLHWYGAWGDTFGGKLALRAALAGGRRHLYIIDYKENDSEFLYCKAKLEYWPFCFHTKKSFFCSWKSFRQIKSAETNQRPSLTKECLRRRGKSRIFNSHE